MYLFFIICSTILFTIEIFCSPKLGLGIALMLANHISYGHVYPPNNITHVSVRFDLAVVELNYEKWVIGLEDLTLQRQAWSVRLFCLLPVG